MTQDPNKKTLRSFQCRDYLWEIFEQMSAELECSVDYLINEAMRQYARSRNYGTRPSQPPQRPGGPPMAPQPPQPGGIPSLSRSAPPPPRPPSAPPPSPPGYGYPQPPGAGNYPVPSQPSGGYMGGPPMAAPPPSYGQPQQAPPPMGPPMAAPPAYQPQPPQRGPSPPPYPQGPPGGGAPPPLPGQGGYGMAQPQRPTLFVIFNGQKIPVAKDEFVIGRGSKTADLPIKDGNISRRHAAVVYQDGAFYMKDLGSTNGIEYGGHRVDTKRIDEGDVFQLCDYELRFTYR